MSLIKIDTVFNIDLQFEAAPFPKRLLAYMIDFVLMIAYLYSMKYFLYAVLGLSSRDYMGLDILLISLPMLLYSLITEVLLNGQTLGKRAMNLRVISLDGGEPTLGQYLIRWICKFFEWPFLFGYIYFMNGMLFVYIIITGILGIAVVVIIAISPKNQRLGDMAAGTVVIDGKLNTGLEDTIFMQITQPDYKVTFPEVMRLSDNDINTIKTILNRGQKSNNLDVCRKVETKVKSVLSIESELPPINFLEKLLEDYNYLATRE